MEDLFLVFKGISTLFSIIAISVYIPTNNVGGFLFSTLSPAFIVCRVFDDGYSDWCSFLVAQIVVGDLGLIPVWEDPLEEGMATHSSIPAWRIGESLWTEEPGRLQSMELQRVGHDQATKHTAHSAWGEVILHCSFDLHFSNNLWIIFLAICMFSLGKCLFSSLAHLWIGSFIFLELSYLYVFEINS